MKQLSREILREIDNQSLVPSEALLRLPEKVLQFGTGVLLRGLPDYFIDKANRQGVFNGRILVVKSTDAGSTDAFKEQDGLYTICVRGIEGDTKQEELILNSSISRVVSARDHWDLILDAAANTELRLVISNTTESGIAFVEEGIDQSPPASFPGKLLAFLHKRYSIFNGSRESGMVIVPAELIPANGDLLKSVLLRLARHNKLSDEFITWLLDSNEFCNSLVDRIVPGSVQGDARLVIERQLGFRDDLMIMAETFRLWAIQTDSEKAREVLSFAAGDDGVVLAPSITRFIELKLRILNGTHSFVCAVALLAGFETVAQAMQDESFRHYTERLMYSEIAVATASADISEDEARSFAGKVVDRFRNPFIEHKWSAIAVNYPSKLSLRSVPLVGRYMDKTAMVPSCMAIALAAFGVLQGSEETGQLIDQLAGDNKLPMRFVDEVKQRASQIREEGMSSVLHAFSANKTMV